MILAIEIIITLLLLALAKWIQDRFTTFDDDHELFKIDNAALGIAKAGYYLGLFVALSGLFMGIGLGDWYEVRDFIIYGILCLALMNVATITVDKIIMKNFHIYEHICDHKSESVAWVLTGSYLGSASVLKGAISGDDAPLSESVIEILVFFLFGQLMLVLTSLLYQWIMPRVHEHLESGNTASGISFGGYLAAVGIIIGEQASGNMDLNSETIMDYLLYSCISLVLLTLIRKYGFRWIFANGESLMSEIEVDENRAAGWITAMASIGLALLLAAALG